MTDSELKQFYNDNQDFREYVDKCRQNSGRKVDEEIKFITIQKVAEYYQERRK